MKRVLTAALIAALLLPTTAHASDWRSKECRYQYHNGKRGWTPWEVQLTIRCAAPKYGVSTSTALQIAYRESHYQQYARNAYSGAAGVYQHIPRYFPPRLRSVPDLYGPFGGSVWNARDNVLAALWLARGGWGPWGG